MLQQIHAKGKAPRFEGINRDATRTGQQVPCGPGQAYADRIYGEADPTLTAKRLGIAWRKEDPAPPEVRGRLVRGVVGVR